MKQISIVEILAFVFLGIFSWLLSLIWLGWLGNLIVTFWAKSRGIRMKNPSHDFLLHLFSPFAGMLPVPAVLAQFFILYAGQHIPLSGQKQPTQEKPQEIPVEAT